MAQPRLGRNRQPTGDQGAVVAGEEAHRVVRLGRVKRQSQRTGSELFGCRLIMKRGQRFASLDHARGHHLRHGQRAHPPTLWIRVDVADGRIGGSQIDAHDVARRAFATGWLAFHGLLAVLVVLEGTRRGKTLTMTHRRRFDNGSPSACPRGEPRFSSTRAVSRRTGVLDPVTYGERRRSRGKWIQGLETTRCHPSGFPRLRVRGGTRGSSQTPLPPARGRRGEPKVALSNHDEHHRSRAGGRPVQQLLEEPGR